MLDENIENNYLERGARRHFSTLLKGTEEYEANI